MIKKKLTVAIVCVISLCLICVTAWFFYTGIAVQHTTPDTSNWNLKNTEFVVVPVIDDSVTFKVENRQGKVVFACDEKWRAWDFKSLGIDDDNTITVDSSDTGTERYVYDGKTWSTSE